MKITTTHYCPVIKLTKAKNGNVTLTVRPNQACLVLTKMANAYDDDIKRVEENGNQVCADFYKKSKLELLELAEKVLN